MAGIVGVFGQPDEVAIRGMLDRLLHRGRDTYGFYLGLTSQLGACQHTPPHMDPAAIAEEEPPLELRIGRNQLGQPYSESSGNLRLVLDGYLTNAGAIRADLQRRGAKFQTDGDEEVIFEAYNRDGYGAFDQFRGAYAIMLWDQRTHTACLARDAFGQRPLYVAANGPALYAASEIAGLEASPAFRRAIDTYAIADLLTWGYILPPRTIWQTVRSIPPGHVGIFRESRLMLRRTHRVDWGDPRYGRDPQDWTVELLARSEQALHDQWLAATHSDPAALEASALELDGGRASWMLGMLATRVWPTVAPRGGGAPTVEWQYAPSPLPTSGDRVARARRLGLNHRRMVVAADRAAGTPKATGGLPSAFRDLVAQLDQPTTDPTLLLDWHGYAATRRAGVRSLVVSDGAEILLGGLERHRELLSSFRSGWVPPLVRQFLGFVGQRLPRWERPGDPTRNSRAWWRRAIDPFLVPLREAWNATRHYLAGLPTPSRDRFLRALQVTGHRDRAALFSPTLLPHVRGHDPTREHRLAFDRLTGRDGPRLADGEGDRLLAVGAAQRAVDDNLVARDWETPGWIAGSIAYAPVRRESRPPIDRAYALDVATSWTVGHIASQEAVASRAGLDLVRPFANPEYASWAASIPAGWKATSHERSRVLRYALRGVPEAVETAIDPAERRDAFTRWLLQPGRLLDDVQAVLRSPDVAARGVLDPAAIEALFRRHRAGRDDAPTALMACYLLELWCQAH